MLKIYNYEPMTGALLCVGDADPSPLDKYSFLVPAFATEIEPPAVGDNQIPVFDGVAWSVKDDFRGTVGYLEDGTEKVISAIGDTLQSLGLLDAKPVPPPEPSPPPPTTEQIIKSFEDALDLHLDAVAKQYRWDNRITFIARAGYPNRWRDQAIAFGIWMDGCNAQAYDLMESVLRGEVPVPESTDAFLAMLPPFVMP